MMDTSLPNDDSSSGELSSSSEDSRDPWTSGKRRRFDKPPNVTTTTSSTYRSGRYSAYGSDCDYRPNAHRSPYCSGRTDEDLRPHPIVRVTNTNRKIWNQPGRRQVRDVTVLDDSTIAKMFPYKCELCGIGFENQKQVEEHSMWYYHNHKILTNCEKEDSEDVIGFLQLCHRNFDENKGKRICCVSCKKVMNVDTQCEAHFSSKEHMKFSEKTGFGDGDAW